ncbi:MAG TPA: hypothetical protein VGG72_35230 [Bryobacteraceae bacterium]|jgi:chromosome partitioning protein
MIRSRGFLDIYKGVVDAGVPVFQTELNDREAYRAVKSFHKTLDGLDPAAVPNLDKAHRNVAEFAQELVASIIAEHGARKEEKELITSTGGA